MNLFGYLFSLFVPRETPDRDPEPDGGNPPDAKPEWVQDKFWDQDSNTVRSEVLSKSFNELEGKLRDTKDKHIEEYQADLRAKVPEDGYKLNMPEGLELPNGVTADDIQIDTEDPLYQWFSEFATDKGLSQEEFDSAISKYVAQEVGNLPDVKNVIEQLGDYGADRIQKVENFLNESLEKDEYTAIQSVLTSAKAIEAVEKLMKRSSAKDFDGDTAPALTLDELRAMQSDRRYLDGDKAFIAKVEAGYKRLYPS